MAEIAAPPAVPPAALVADPARLAALRAVDLLDTEAEAEFDGLTALAAEALGAPIALVSLVDRDRQFFKSALGLSEPFASARETALSHSFCQHVVASGAPLLVNDAAAHPLVCDNLAIPDLGVAAYLGVPLTTTEGHTLGSLCVIDVVPRTWTPRDAALLARVAAAVMTEIALRAAVRTAIERADALRAAARTAAERAGAVRAAERRFRAAANAARDALVTTDVEGHVRFWPASAERLFGRTAAEMTGRPLAAVFPERLRGALVLTSLAGADGAPTAEAPVAMVGLRADGAEFPLEVSVGAWVDGEGQAFIAVLRDASERHRADAERERLTAVLEATTDLVSIVEPSGRVTFLNRAGRQLLGLPETGDLAGLTADAMHPPGVADAIRAAAKSAVFRDGSWRGQTEVHTRDGRVVPVSEVILGHRDPATGALAYFSAVMRDMSAERAAAAALVREREFLHAVLESLHEGVVACDAEGRLTLFNGAARAFHGLPEDGTVPPERWAEHYSLYGPDGTTPLARDVVPLFRALHDGAVDGAAIVIAVPNQPPRAVAASGRRFADASGKVLGAVVAMHDVTARARAEAALRASEARFRAAMAASPDACVLLEAVRDAAGSVSDFRFLEANAGTFALYGVPPEDLHDRLLCDLFPVLRGSALLACYVTVAETGEPYEGEYQTRDPRSQAGWLWVQAAAMRGADGTVVGLAVTARDITVRKRAQGQRRLLHEVTAALSGAADADAALVAALAAMCEASGLPYGEVWVPAATNEADGNGGAEEGTGTTGTLVRGPAWHAPGDAALAAFDEASRAFAFAPGEGLPGLAAAAGAPVWLADVTAPDADFPRAAHARLAGLRGGLAVPILADGAVVAVLAFHERHAAAVDPAELDRLSAVGAQVGAVVRRRQAEAALGRQKERLKLIYDSTSDLMFLMAVERDAAGAVTGYRCESVNAAYLAVTGLAEADVVGRTIEEILPPMPAAFALGKYALAEATGDAQRYDQEIDLPTGRVVVETTLTPVLNDAGRCTRLLGVARDVGARRALEARLAALSEHDDLTGLLNRRGFRGMADQAMRSAARSHRHDAVLCVDLDRFKRINDSYGHAAGDEALRAVADVLRTTMRDADFGARLGGDEFAIFAVGLRAGEGEVIAARLQASVAAHNAAAEASGRPFSVGFSVGVAEFRAGDTLDTLLARADDALYAEKSARRP